MSGANYYQLLGINATATENEIRRAYLRLSLQWHPDKRRGATGEGDDVFRSIQEAYETLSCPEKRCLYDFVGAFAALADVTSCSLPVTMPGQNRRQHCTGPSDSSMWSCSSSGDVLHSWGPSPSPSAARSSPCPSSDTCLSSSPGTGTTGSGHLHNGPGSMSRDASGTVASPSSLGVPVHGGTLLPPSFSPPAVPPQPSALHQHQQEPRSQQLLQRTSRQPVALSTEPDLMRPSPAAEVRSLPSASTSPTSLLGKRRAPAADRISPHRTLHNHHPQQQLQPHLHGGDALGLHAAATAGVASSADVHHLLLLTLEELYSGCIKQLRLARRVHRAVEGTGAGGGPQAQEACWCVEELFRVEVQPGWREGTKVKFPGKGDELPCGSKGDMVLLVAQAAHGRYERRGNDLHTVVVVPLVDALTGGDAAITMLDGRTLVLPLGPACLQPFSEQVLRGEGMPIPPGRARGGRPAAGASRVADGAVRPLPSAPGVDSLRGDLHVRFEVSFPDDLTPEQKEELRGALLGPPAGA